MTATQTRKGRKLGTKQGYGPKPVGEALKAKYPELYEELAAENNRRWVESSTARLAKGQLIQGRKSLERLKAKEQEIKDRIAAAESRLGTAGIA